MIRIEVEGTERVQQALGRAGAAAQRSGVPDGLDAAALLVTTRAKLKAPVDTGALRAAIAPKRVSESEAQVQSPMEYSVYQEFGTCYMPAQPYMRPALDESKAEIEKLVGRAVMTAVEAALL